MDLIEAIYHRRAVRHYTSEEVSAATLQELLRAAVQAPSPLNSQSWSFAVFCGRPRLTALSLRIKDHLLATLPPLYELHEHASKMNDPAYDVFHGAPAFIVICAKPEGYGPEETCSLAAQNLMLAAHAVGLATCPIGFVRGWLRMPHIKDELGIPATHNPVFPLVLGHPAGQPKLIPRREPDIVVWHQPSPDQNEKTRST
ncbi:MAG: nitroreductase [Opitutaceae bacterium]